MTERYLFPDEETKKRCLDGLRKSNRQLELYNLFLDDSIAQIELEARQQKRERLLQRVRITE